MRWQTLLALAIVLCAAAAVVRLALIPFIAMLLGRRPPRCPAGCGCSHGREACRDPKEQG